MAHRAGIAVIVGRPNVGKSTLLNALVCQKVAIVTPRPQTTRTRIIGIRTLPEAQLVLVDTPGLHQARSLLNRRMVDLARTSLSEADVAILVVDSPEGATDQDAAIAGEADQAGSGILIAANKWDLMKGRGADFSKEFDDKLRQQLKFLDYAPILHISAMTGERAPKVIETIDRIAIARRQRIQSSALNKFVEEVTRANPPVSPGRRQVRIMYAAQVGVAPPSFVFFTNVATKFHFSYERFLVNQLREQFGFAGTPIRIQVRRRKK